MNNFDEIMKAQIEGHAKALGVSEEFLKEEPTPSNIERDLFKLHETRTARMRELADTTMVEMVKVAKEQGLEPIVIDSVPSVPESWTIGGIIDEAPFVPPSNADKKARKEAKRQRAQEIEDGVIYITMRKRNTNKSKAQKQSRKNNRKKK